MKKFKTESKRVLDLMINSIYTNKEIFLRELLSNASDAIDKLKFISLTDTSVNSDFKITISVDKSLRTLIIEDNGIGMNEKDLEKNLGTIAESGTLAFKMENQNVDNQLIGQFGVGFYSAFMVAESIQVYTKAYGENKGFKWESSGVEGYSITEIDKANVGTKIVLKIKENSEEYDYSEFLDQNKISSLVKKYSDFIKYPIEMEISKRRLKDGPKETAPEYEEYKEVETLNSMIPLWKKAKSEVSEENLNQFYKNEFKDFFNPLKSVYAKIEGNVTYDTLLFFPSKAPIDYYSKDYKKGVKLYCNGVLIMDKCEELIPDYFGFVKGIIDSPDLSLNISREILQQDRQVKIIAQSVEKRITSELKKLQENERETYEKLFAEFGLSIKFGVYAGFGMNKDKLKDLLMFYSSKEEKLITLSEYVAKMSEEQQDIYYACGESYEKISKLPQIEKAKEKGLEILYFKDGVDEFVAKILIDYEGKKFKSISEADFSIDQKEKEDLDKKNEEFKELTLAIKEDLGDKVKEVRLTSNLKTYPVCLISSGDVSIEMEKVFASMPNADGKIKAEKILEISCNHKILQVLQNVYKNDREQLKKYSIVLYEQARLLEGLAIEDVAEFVKSISDIIA